MTPFASRDAIHHRSQPAAVLYLGVAFDQFQAGVCELLLYLPRRRALIEHVRRERVTQPVRGNRRRVASALRCASERVTHRTECDTPSPPVAEARMF